MWTLRKAVIRLALSVARRRKFDVEGRDTLLETTPPYIIVCNHPSLADSLYLILAAPHELTICGARPRYFSTFLKRRVMAFLRIIRVEGRERFIRDCLALLDEDRCLLLYPEMKRNPRGIGHFETWAAEVALESGAPVVPCFIDGTHEGQTGPVTLRVGGSVSPEASDPGTLTGTFFERIQALDSRSPT